MTGQKDGYYPGEEEEEEKGREEKDETIFSRRGVKIWQRFI